MKSSPLNPRHEAAGARLAARPEAPASVAALTYGDVPAEYRAALEACVVLDETARGRVSVRGSDAASFLHRILANDVRGLSIGQGNRNLLLTPKGKVLHDFDLLVAADAVELSTPPGADTTLLSALDTYLFSEDVVLETSTAEHAPLELVGPDAAATLQRALGASPPEDEHATTWTEDSIAMTRKTVAGRLGYRVDPGPERAVSVWERLIEAGARPTGIAVRDILRVEACSALWGVDVDENVYPQEARLEDAFDLTKGCYVGQEVVAKIDTYGGLNKRLMQLVIDGDDPVARGTRLLLEEHGETREIGLVTSWAYSFVHESGLTLAYVKRRHQEPGTSFELEGSGATATITG